MFQTMKRDIDAIMDRDPAARSRLEVFLLYPGFKAVRSHRMANWFYRHDMKLIARYISQRSRHKTGIEIHPGAQIGKGLFIDHGMGVVIGETTEIGDDCTIYQNVTLGGTGKDHGKRHPTLGNNVVVGSGAKVLGPFRVGDNARVAAGAVVLAAVPDNATAVGVPARIARINGIRTSALDQIHGSDPVAQELCKLQVEYQKVNKELEELKKQIAQDHSSTALNHQTKKHDQKCESVSDPVNKEVCELHMQYQTISKELGNLKKQMGQNNPSAGQDGQEKESSDQNSTIGEQP